MKIEKIFIGIIFSLILAIIMVKKIELRINSLLMKYINEEVERFSTNIVSKAISDVMVSYDKDDLIIVDKYVDNKFIYDTVKINKIQNKIIKEIQLNLNKLDSGYFDEFFALNRLHHNRYRYIKEGILCEISMGSINKSVLFTNIGPTIPLRIFFSSQLSTEIEIETKEYGINNVMVTFFLKINLKEQINMPLSSKTKKIVLREPISIEIINGEVPKYYNR